MFKLISVNKNNYNKFCQLFIDRANFNSYYSYKKMYNVPNIIIKFFRKEFSYLIYLEDKFIGFIIIQIKDKHTIKINDFYLENKYYSKFKFENFSVFKNKIIIFSILSSNSIERLISNNSFIELNSTYLLEKQIIDFKYDIDDEFLHFRQFRRGTDESLRCRLQNDIFYSENRIPITIDEIRYEVNSEIFLGNLSFFMYYKNTPIGYIQVILWENKYLIVNFGIIYKYRSRGYGKKLLLFLINEISKIGINTVFIKVDINNIKAMRLYLGCGFQEIGIHKDFICQIN